MAAPTIRKAYADSPLGQIHYRYTAPSPTSIKSNPEKLPILFLHMSASSSAIFEQLMTVYTSLGHACYAPDMPGFGASFDPPSSSSSLSSLDSPSSIKWYIDLYVATFFESGAFPSLSRGCHVLGHHSGGVIGVEFAVSHPEHVKSLAVIGPVLMDLAQRRAAAQSTRAFNEPSPDGTHLAKTWEYLQSHGGITTATAAEMALLQRETLDHARAWRGRLQIYKCVFADEADGPALYKQVRCPLIAMCARDDVLWSGFGRMAEIRPDVEAVEVGGANFTPGRDPEGVERHYTPFLKRLDV